MKKYFSLVKFSHSIFALPFALLGFCFAIFLEHQTFYLNFLIFILLCMISARNVAMAFNRLVDYKIDSANLRTAMREIPTGKIKPTQAKIFILINGIIFIVSSFFINRLCFFLSPIALIIIMGYSYMKKITPLCHIILGIGLGLAPVGSFIAITKYFTFYIVGLGLATMLWVGGFDIVYALQDFDFDKKNNLKSIPVFLGINSAKNVAVFLHCLCVLILGGLIYFLHLNILAWCGLVFFMYFIYKQHKQIDLKNLIKIDATFFFNNGLASIIFATLLILDLMFFKT